MAFTAQNLPTTRQIIIGIALLGLAALLWLNRTVVVLGFAAIVLATLLRSIADPLSRRTGLAPRWCVVIVVLVLVAAAVALGWLFGARVGDEFAQLRQQIPEAMEKVQSWLQRSPRGQSVVEALKHASQGGVLGKFGLAATALVGAVGNIVLIFFGGLYLAIDPRLYRTGVLRLLPVHQRARVGDAFAEAGTALRKWLGAQLMLMVIVGTLTGIGLALLGVPLALSLALLIGVLEFIPFLGPILGAAPGILLAFTKGPDVALYALLVYVGVQQIENNVLTPLIQRWAVELPPVLALFSIVVCGATFGLLGILFATPMAVVGMTLIRKLYVEDTLERGSDSRS